VSLLEQTQPFRYANLNAGRGDPQKAIAIFRRLAALGTGRERAWALAEIGIIYPSTQEALEASNEAVRLDPANPFAYGGRISANAHLGHSEAVAQDLQSSLNAISGHLPPDVLPSAVYTYRFASEAWLREIKGAFEEAAAFNLQREQRSAFKSDEFEWMEAASNHALAHDGAAARLLLSQYPTVGIENAFARLHQTNFSLPAQLVLEIGSGD